MGLWSWRAMLAEAAPGPSPLSFIVGAVTVGRPVLSESRHGARLPAAPAAGPGRLGFLQGQPGQTQWRIA
jgi:hypothetical protein